MAVGAVEADGAGLTCSIGVGEAAGRESLPMHPPEATTTSTAVAAHLHARDLRPMPQQDAAEDTRDPGEGREPMI